MSKPHHDGLDNLNALARRQSVAELFHAYDCVLWVARLFDATRIVVALAAAARGNACPCGRFPSPARQRWCLPHCYECVPRDDDEE